MSEPKNILPLSEHWRLTTLLVNPAAYNEWRSCRIEALKQSTSYEQYCQLIEEVDANFVSKYNEKPVYLKPGTGILKNAKFAPNALSEKTPVDLKESKGHAYHCPNIAFGPNGGIDWKELDVLSNSRRWTMDGYLSPQGIYGGSSKPTSSCKKGSECVGSCPCKEGSANGNGGSQTVDLGSVQNGVTGSIVDLNAANSSMQSTIFDRPYNPHPQDSKSTPYAHFGIKSSVNDGVLNQVGCQIPEPPKLRDWVLKKDMDFFGMTFIKGTIFRRYNPLCYIPIVDDSNGYSLNYSIIKLDYRVVENNADYFKPYETDLQLEAKDHITLCEAAQELLFNDKEETLAIMVQIGNNLSFGLCCNHTFAEFLSNEIKEARLCYDGKPNKFE